MSSAFTRFVARAVLLFVAMGATGFYAVNSRESGALAEPREVTQEDIFGLAAGEYAVGNLPLARAYLAELLVQPRPDPRAMALAICDPDPVIGELTWSVGGPGGTEACALAVTEVGRPWAVGFMDGRLTLHSTDDVLTTQPHRNRIRAMAWNAEGTLLATGGSDGICAVTTCTGRLVSSLQSLDAAVVHLSWMSNSTLLIVTSDGRLREWDYLSESPTSVYGKPMHLVIHARTALHRNLVVLSSARGEVAVYDAKTRSVITSIPLASGSLPLTLSEETVLIGLPDGDLAVASVLAKPEIIVIPGSGTGVECLTSYGRRVAAGYQDGAVRQWNLPDERSKVWRNSSADSVTSLGYFGNGAVLCAGTAAGAVMFLDSSSGLPIGVKGSAGSPVVAMCCSDSLLAWVQQDGGVHLIDLRVSEASLAKLLGRVAVGDIALSGQRVRRK